LFHHFNHWLVDPSETEEIMEGNLIEIVLNKHAKWSSAYIGQAGHFSKQAFQGRDSFMSIGRVELENQLYKLINNDSEDARLQ
jgi:hypothetical protein